MILSSSNLRECHACERKCKSTYGYWIKEKRNEIWVNSLFCAIEKHVTFIKKIPTITLNFFLSSRKIHLEWMQRSLKMEQMPLWYLACGILVIACGVTVVMIGVSRIIASRVARELKKWTIPKRRKNLVSLSFLLALLLLVWVSVFYSLLDNTENS